MTQLELHDGTLSYKGWTKVIYKGKEFDTPIDSTILMAWDYIYYLLKKKSYRLWMDYGC